MTPVVEIVVAMIGAGAVTAVLNYFFGKRLQTASANKTDAERQDIIANAATKAVELIEGQLTVATSRIQELELSVSTLRAKLESQAAEHAAEVSQYRATIARYELDLATLRARVSDLERELAKARSAT